MNVKRIRQYRSKAAANKPVRLDQTIRSGALGQGCSYTKGVVTGIHKDSSYSPIPGSLYGKYNGMNVVQLYSNVWIKL